MSDVTFSRRDWITSSLTAGAIMAGLDRVVSAEDRPAVAEQRRLNVFLFAGQSNMAGADSVVVEPPGFQQTEADRATRFTCAPLPDGDQSSQYVRWGDIRGHRSSPAGKLVHGPEVGFARALHAAGWRDMAIIKVYANFSRDAKVETWPWGPQGHLFQAWTKFVDSRLSELSAPDSRFQVRGFVWHQGIDDAIHGELAGRYQQNLTALIGILRTRYANQAAPFVLARSVNSSIARGITGSGENDPMAIVRRAQVAIGKSVPHTDWIDVDDLPNVNRHHFTAEGQLSIGQRFGQRFLQVLQKTSDPQSK